MSVSGTLTSGKLVLTDTTGNTDAFSRLRVSFPQTLFEMHPVFGRELYIMDEFDSGDNATISWDQDNTYIKMELTNTGTLIRQSYEYIPYQPGKSKLMLFTGVMEANAGGKSGCTARIGCFDSSGHKTYSGALGVEGAKHIIFDGTTDVDADNNQIDFIAHGFTDEDPVLYLNGGGGNIGLTNERLYYINSVDANTINLEAVAGNGESIGLSAASGSAHSLTTTAPFNANTGVSETTITSNGHGFIDGMSVLYHNNGGTSITQLTHGNSYYITSATTNTFGLANFPGGSAISLTDGLNETHTITSGAKSLSPGNGLFFELSDSSMHVVIRNASSDSRVVQTAWNVDRFDGTSNATNPSGLTVNDWSKAYIFAIDQEWLGVGTVRFGFFINGSFREAHRFNHSGLGTPTSTAITAPYIRYAKLPIRYEISHTAATTVEMRQFCSTILSEGGFEPTGIRFASSSNIAKTLGTTFIPLFSLKLRETEPFNRASIILKSIHLLNQEANAYAHFYLYILPDSSYLTGANWQIIDSESSCAEYDTTATAINTSGAISFSSGYLEVQTARDYPFQEYINSPKINSNITGRSRVLSIAAINVQGVASTYAGMNWLEIR